jgi:Uma2 family endonuclease
MAAFPEQIRSDEVRPVTVADDIHRMTVDEYLHIVHDLGWQSTELIEGVVYDVTPEHSRHAATVMHAFRQLDAHLGADVTWLAGSVRLSAHSLVDPDVLVLDPGVPLDLDDVMPVEALRLAVEVSVTTQRRDRGPKLIAYAKAAVPEVWLIDPRPDAGELLRHRDPRGASYGRVDRFDVGEGAEHLDVAAILAR